MFNGDFKARSISIAKDGGQRLRYEVIYDARLGGKNHKIRITIISDSYKDQCEAKAERFGGSNWQALGRLATGEMTTPAGLSYGKPSTADAFAKDVEALKAKAEAILG